MKLVKLFIAAVGADLSGWNRYSNQMAQHNPSEIAIILSPQDELIHELVKRQDYAALDDYLRIIRNRHQKLLELHK